MPEENTNSQNEQIVSWADQTKTMVAIAKASGMSGDDLRKVIAAFLNIDVAIKIAHETERLLTEYKAGNLGPTDFLDAIINVMHTDKPMIGAKTEVLHGVLGVPIIQKAPRVKKPATNQGGGLVK